MNNDIVKDLRAMADIVDDSYGKLRITMVSGKIFKDAADEIERLRSAGDALAKGVRTGHWDDALDAWEDHPS